ncbi:uncharacterized protein LOC143289596 [Babylonia areolata]|uniref:uncharacterized protein LOC143289596 n=1 Tax=Babylonia areolata TaxID=304850 RepID=UPI003FD1ECB1
MAVSVQMQNASYLPNVSEHTPLHKDCIEIRFSQMEFLPWNNIDNIISEDVEKHARKIKNYMITFLIFFGGPANIINMAVFCKQSLKDRVNLCLFSLSLADGIYLVAVSFLHGDHLTTDFDDYGPIATFFTNNNLNAFIGFVFVSFVLSAIIACERCLCILSPLKFQTLLRTRTMAVIIVTVYTVLISLFYVVSFRYFIACVYDPELGIVLRTMVKSPFYRQHQEFIDIVDSVVLGTGLTGTVMAVVVTTTILTTVKLRQIVTWREETSSSISPREVALTKMLIGSSVLFIVCISPACVLRVATLFLPELNAGGRQHNLYFMCLWITEGFAFINASFNFLVYYKMGSRYRETFWALFCRKAQKGNA